MSRPAVQRSKRGRELLEAVLAEVERWLPEVRPAQEPRAKGAIRLSFMAGEREVWLFLTATPSDKKSVIAMVTEVRRRMRAAGVEPPQRGR